MEDGLRRVKITAVTSGGMLWCEVPHVSGRFVVRSRPVPDSPEGEQYFRRYVAHLAAGIPMATEVEWVTRDKEAA